MFLFLAPIGAAHKKALRPRRRAHRNARLERDRSELFGSIVRSIRSRRVAASPGSRASRKRCRTRTRRYWPRCRAPCQHAIDRILSILCKRYRDGEFESTSKAVLILREHVSRQVACKEQESAVIGENGYGLLGPWSEWRWLSSEDLPAPLRRFPPIRKVWRCGWPRPQEWPTTWQGENARS
jgi:hypothetical protein